MLMISPYSEDSLFASGGKCEANTTNFPALASFFKFDEIVGGTITDSISGVSHTDAANLIYDSTFGGMSCAINAGTQPTVGTMPNPGTKDILIVGAGLLSSVRSQVTLGFGIGTVTASAGGVLFANNTGGTSTCGFADGSTTVSSTALSAVAQDVKVGGAFAIDRGAIHQTRRFPNATGATVAQTSGGISQVTDVTGVLPFEGIRFIGIMFGFAAFYFSSGLPANWQAGAAWMAQQWINGNKWIYPGFKDLT